MLMRTVIIWQLKNNVDFNMYDLIFITKTNKIDMQSLIKNYYK